MAKVLHIRLNPRTENILRTRMRHSRARTEALLLALARYDEVCSAERNKVCLTFEQLLILRTIARTRAPGFWASAAEDVMRVPGVDVVQKRDYAKVQKVADRADRNTAFRIAVLDGFEQADIAIAAEVADEERARQIVGGLFQC